MNNCIRVDFLSPYSVLYIRAEIHYTYLVYHVLCRPYGFLLYNDVDERTPTVDRELT